MVQEQWSFFTSDVLSRDAGLTTHNSYRTIILSTSVFLFAAIQSSVVRQFFRLCFSYHNQMELSNSYLFLLQSWQCIRVIRDATIFCFHPTGLAGLGCSVGLEIPSDGLRDQSYKTGGISRAGIGSEGAGPLKAIGSTMVPNPVNSPQEKLSSTGETQIPSKEKGSRRIQ